MKRKAGLPKTNKLLPKPTYRTLQAIAALYWDVVDKAKQEHIDSFCMKDLMLGIFDVYFTGKISKRQLVKVLIKGINLDGLQLVVFLGALNVYKNQYKWEYGPSEMIVRRFLKVSKIEKTLSSVKKGCKNGV